MSVMSDVILLAQSQDFSASGTRWASRRPARTTRQAINPTTEKVSA
jgi:hypothetical protein